MLCYLSCWVNPPPLGEFYRDHATCRGSGVGRGLPFYVVYNDKHWNNKLAHLEYLRALFDTLTPCSCGDPNCTSHLVIYDRFSGHFSTDIIKLFRARKISPCVVEGTGLAQPGDFRFHRSVKQAFEAETLDHLVQRRRASRAKEEKGDFPPKQTRFPTTRARLIRHRGSGGRCRIWGTLLPRQPTQPDRR